MPETASRSPSLAGQIHYRGCNLCEAMCGLEIHLDSNGAISAIRGDKKDPLSRGHICPKAVALQDIQDDADRLRQPVKRKADGSFETISWDEAFELTANGIRNVQEQHGREAMASYLGNPNVHNYGSLLFGPPVLKALRTPNRYSATSVDQLPHHLAAYFMFGHDFLLPIPDIDHTDFFLVMGGNPAVSNGSLMTAPDVKKRLKAIRERGGKIVVLDPRRTETAALADQHLFIRPGTDALLLAAVVYTLLHELGVTPSTEWADGLEELRAAIDGFTPEAVAPVTGIDADAIRRLAGELNSAPSAVAYGRMGLSTQEFGAVCQWLLNTINWLTGNLDRRGGAMIPLPAADVVARRRGGSYGRWRTRTRNLPEVSGELPVVALAEEMLTDGPGQIRGLLTAAGNPVLSTPDGRQLDEALENLDFMVSIDLYINETTRHADVILPPTAPLEHDHYDLAFHALAIRDTSRYSPALFQAAPGALHDWQIYAELLRRLRPKVSIQERLGRWLSRKMGPSGMLDVLLRTGPHGAGMLGLGKGLTLKRLKAQPHGVDLGPLKPVLRDRIRTKNKHIQLAPKLFVDDLTRLRAKLDDSRRDDSASELLLIGRRQVRSNNSWMHNYPRLMRGKDRCTLLMHPDDAAERNISVGQIARVSSRVGSVEVPVELSDEIMRGVVSIPHGWGHHRSGARLSTAGAHPGVSINDLTDPTLIDELSGNAAFSGVPVQVEAMTSTENQGSKAVSSNAAGG